MCGLCWSEVESVGLIAVFGWVVFVDGTAGDFFLFLLVTHLSQLL